MNRISNPSKALKAAVTGCFGLCLAAVLSNCNQADTSVAAPDKAEAQVTREAETPTLVSNEQAALEKSALVTSYLHFGDRNACIYNPDICKYGMVFHPGYIQPVGSDWGYVTTSNGPWTGPVGPEPHSMTNKHFHIIGLMNPAQEPNPMGSAMWGNWWMYVYMARNGVGRINFDLTQIHVRGTVPVRVWYKDAAGNGYQWSSLAPGRWNLPGATNIQEVQISSASSAQTPYYQVDDIRVTPR